MIFHIATRQRETERDSVCVCVGGGGGWTVSSLSEAVCAPASDELLAMVQQKAGSDADHSAIPAKQNQAAQRPTQKKNKGKKQKKRKAG